LAAEGEAAGAEGAEAAAAPAPAEDGWEYSITPYFWAAGVKGNTTADGTRTSVDADFSDILDLFQFGLAGHVEAQKGDLFFFVNPMYMKLGEDFHAMGTKVDLTVQLLLTDFGAGYVLGEMPLGDDGQKLTFAGTGGARYMYLKTDVDIRGASDVHDSQDWIDLVLGTRVVWTMNDKWSFIARADAGGFHIGSSSDLSWGFSTIFDWRFSDNKSLKFGYRVLDVDYDRTPTFGFDAKMQGPIVGLTWYL
jgi:hypothetical protein